MPSTSSSSSSTCLTIVEKQRQHKILLDKKPSTMLMEIETEDEKYVPKVRYSVSKEIGVGWWISWRYRNIKERLNATFYPVPFSEYDLIPDELWLLVFQFLPSRCDLDMACLVCKDFLRVGQDPKLQQQFWLQKIPAGTHWTGTHIPISVMIIGDKGIGKTTFATQFLNDNTNSLRGFGTRYLSTTSTPAPDAKDVISVSLWDVADASKPRSVLAFPVLCDVICLCIDLTLKDPNRQEIEEWIFKAHEATHKTRSRLGHSERAPFVIVSLRGNLSPTKKVKIEQIRDAVGNKLQVASAFIEVDATKGSVDTAFETMIDCVRRNGGKLSNQLSSTGGNLMGRVNAAK